MCGNGAKTGMVIIARSHKPTQKAQLAAPAVCCVVAAGATRLRIAVLPTATPASRLSAITPTVFGWCFPSKQLGVPPFKLMSVAKGRRDD